ncbi:MAG: hypothetical protein Q8Q48_00450 [Candidatus Staskawiczbacteria bacterium]|nr:hypothetical protein [Candidatus Staskawiczbacteria bacterium]
MFKKIALITLLFIFLPLNLNLLAPKFASAATNDDTAVVLQPSKTMVTASPGQKVSRSFSIINRSNYPLTLKLVVKDYKQISDDGKLEFYDAEIEPASSWIVPQYLQIGLKPLETKEIGFVINVPENFTGGGHYGVILFESVDGSQGLGTSSFGELILLTVAGNDLKVGATAKTVNFYTGLMQQGNPVDFNFKMQNIGNTHFISQGKLILKDWLGKEAGNYNVGELIVYPGTEKLFQWRWSDTPGIGLYKAEVWLADASANDTGLKLVDGRWFILFPWMWAVGILLAILSIFALVKFRKTTNISKIMSWRAKDNKVKIKNLNY